MSFLTKTIVTYADENLGTTGGGRTGQVMNFAWVLNNSNYLEHSVSTLDSNGETGRPVFIVETAGVTDFVVGSNTYYSPGVNIPMNMAGRYTSSAMNGALHGTALTENATPTTMVDLSAQPLQLGPTSDNGGAFTGTISKFLMWGEDITDAGIAEASTP
jgi:hypothetical protein